ncbi:hypothetical protein D9758_012017 [Tetrapyrgos nigripes]|uniref:Oxidation resistance protein 1 n=1 Tax=Tetrapyrgos nigripes TaxID=182062 RepID=A0A8H5FQM0_9AGAR|nr:hypothetical protein D9758_012017 [Tetrapyrgos nigripes]
MNPSISSFSLLQTSSQSEEERRRKEEEAMMDKFAILFSPPTPRASPVPGASSDDIWKPSGRPSEVQENPMSPDSEFGSFVSVPASEDPLTSFPSFGDIPSTTFNPPATRPRHAQNSSLDFFDKFSQEAKERNQRGLLDELLLHEDDPLYWLKDTTNSQRNGNGKSHTIHQPKAQNAEPSPFLIDLDFDSPSQHSKVESEPSKPTHPTRQSSLSSPSHSPTRSSTLKLPHTLAPPVTSPTLSAPATPETEIHPSMGARSSSYQTLTNISSRWMSSLIAPKYPNANSSSSSHPSGLETLFNAPIASHTRSSTVPTHTTHATPFSGSIQQHSSPFAPHIFVPASGAPGFTGDSYDWDKGFSQELDRELTESGLLEAAQQSNETNQSTSSSSVASSVVSGLTRPATPSQSQGTRIGTFIEKRTGSIELRGRREATVGVLSSTLADELRSHLPALSRLPKTWTLLYSLDQHGISLNTLYTKCEAQPQLKSGSNIITKVGAFVVMKDSNDMIFGVYVGDGVHKGRGYYGSGESFLWKYDHGKLTVFKWTGKNEYVALCEPDYISFGGGDGAYGLYLDDSLFDGSSARCPTFENEPLCSPGPKKGRSVTFECVGLEVWGVGP